MWSSDNWLAATMLALCLSGAGSIAAQEAQSDIFVPPPGCVGFLTVQSRQCEMANYYRCNAINPDHRWRALFNAEGLIYIGRLASEGAWIELIDLVEDTKETITVDSPDIPSFTTLIEAGADQYVYYLVDNSGSKSRLVGTDRLTGKSIVIDGIRLDEVDFRFEEYTLDNDLIENGFGQQFIVPEWKMFFSGLEYWGEGADAEPVDNTPVQFIFPGEKGFFSTRPLFDCEMAISDSRGNYLGNGRDERS
jgi:hypothetical protein